MKVVGHGAVGRLEQYIGDAAAFGSRQEGRDEGIGSIQLGIDPQRPAGEKHGDDRNAARAQAAQQLQIRLIPRAVFDGADIALEFGVGILAEHNYRDVRPVLEIPRRTQLGGPARSTHRGANSREDRFAVRKVLVGHPGSLPGNRPAAALFGDVVRAVAGNQHARVRTQG